MGEDAHKAFKSTCITNAEETIENEAATEEGIDEMTAFAASCGPAGAPYPCILGESYSVAGVNLPWPSELVMPSYDAVEGVEVGVTCEHGLTALYHPPGHLWNLKFGPNILVPLEASGIFKNKHSGGNYFYFKGNTAHEGDEIALKSAKYAGVR